MLTRIRKFFISLFDQDQSPEQLAAAFCVGNYIAFSPFFGFHGVMVVLFSWLMGLNFAIMFAAAYGINNIWTAIPIYTADYLFGHWLLHTVFNVPVALYTPDWLESISQAFAHYTSLAKPCMISFLVGGNVLGIITSLALYPIIVRICRVIRRSKTQKMESL